MREIRFADENLGVCVLAFDGRVVEVYAMLGPVIAEVGAALQAAG